MNEEEYRNLLFGIRRSIRYHSKRLAFFDRLDKTANFSILVISFGVFAVAPDYPKAAMGLGFAIAVLSSAQISFGLASKAADHARLRSAYGRLEQILTGSKSKRTIERAQKRRIELEGSEPEVKRYLDVICHNELALAEGHGEREFWKLAWWQRALAHFVNAGSVRFERLES